MKGNDVEFIGIFQQVFFHSQLLEIQSLFQNSKKKVIAGEVACQNNLKIPLINFSARQKIMYVLGFVAATSLSDVHCRVKYVYA